MSTMMPGQIVAVSIGTFQIVVVSWLLSVLMLMWVSAAASWQQQQQQQQQSERELFVVGSSVIAQVSSFSFRRQLCSE
jgi:exosome complex RNA-binding protein Rrp4